jgi:hypothetical protein
VTTATALLQVGGNVFPGQRAGQVAQALLALVVVRVQDDETGLALPVEKVGPQRDLTPQVGKQVAHVQGLVHADVAAVVNLAGVQVPAPDEPLGQYQGRPGEFRVRN